MGIIVNLLVSTVAVLISAYIIPDVHVDSLITGFTVAIVLGVLNAFLKPLLTILTLPITVLTLGLFSLVINTVLILMVSYLVPGFTVTTVLGAFLFSISVSLVNSFLSSLAKD